MTEEEIQVIREERFSRDLHNLGYSHQEICILMRYFRANEIDIAKVTKSKYCTITRKKESEFDWIDPRSNKKILPFGMINGKIIVPEYYKWIKKEDSDEPDMELIYNLTMISSNVNYWLLLRYHQKQKLYKLLRTNPKKKVFSYRETNFTFDQLLVLIIRVVAPTDPALDYIIDEYRSGELTSEEVKMIKNNIDKILQLENIEYPFRIKPDIYVLTNLEPYRMFIWEFISEFVEMKKMKYEWRLDARPNIKTIYFKHVQ